METDTNSYTADKTRKDALLRVFLWEYKWTILSGVIPRLCQIGFTFAQPFLVQRVLQFMSEADESFSYDAGNGLVGAYALVYIGIAVNTFLVWLSV